MSSISQASERAFLGAVINGDTRATDHGFSAEDFTSTAFQKIFSLCQLLEAQGKQADLVTLFDTDNSLDASLLTELMQEASIERSLIDQHAANIKEASMRRRLITLSSKLTQAAQDSKKPAGEIVNRARIALDKIAARLESGDIMSGTDVLIEFYTWLEGKGEETTILTGFSRLDMHLCGGIRGKKLAIIGARPAVGKSALLSHIAVNNLKSRKRVLYVSLEMSEREIISRMIALLSGVSAGKLEARTLSDGDYAAIMAEPAQAIGDHFQISTKARTPGAIRRLALQMKAAGGLDLICVDYLQLLHADVKCAGRVEEVGEISRSLKLLAMELDIPVIAAAQVNRASAFGADRPPQLSELRESGSIEQDADIVFLMHAPNAESDQQDEQWKKSGVRPISLTLAKNRQGSTGMINLNFEGCRMRFMQLEKRRQPA